MVDGAGRAVVVRAVTMAVAAWEGWLVRVATMAAREGWAEVRGVRVAKVAAREVEASKARCWAVVPTEAATEAAATAAAWVVVAWAVAAQAVVAATRAVAMRAARAAGDMACPRRAFLDAGEGCAPVVPRARSTRFRSMRRSAHAC